MPVTVRRATTKDRSVVLAYHRALYRTHRDKVMPDGMLPLVGYRDFDGVLRDDVDAMLADDDTAVLVAELDGKPVGYATGHVETDPRRIVKKRGVLGDWYVDETVRGEGVGAAFVATLELVFRGMGCDAMESATWAFNEGARRAHEKLGFHEVQIVYRKVLEPTKAKEPPKPKKAVKATKAEPRG